MKASPIRTALLAPAAGPGVGGGHVLRCLTLAEALEARGVGCAFAVNEAGADLIARFGASFTVHPAPTSDVVAQNSFDFLVIDDYAVSSEAEQPLRDRVVRLVVIDDLADRPHLADLLVDSGYGRTQTDYEGLLPKDACRLIGPDYALVRSAFATRRPNVLAKAPQARPRRLFMSFGLSDVEGVAARAEAAVRAHAPDLHIDLALASETESAEVLRARARSDPRLHLHFDTRDVAALMASADIAVGAGGASTWERCCLGLPTLAVIVAENQRATIRRLERDGALMAVDLHDPSFEARINEALVALWPRPARTAMREQSAALCDGLGARRVAEAILAL